MNTTHYWLISLVHRCPFLGVSLFNGVLNELS
nr:MAG TPA: 5-aminolevulinate synthase [Caudoviricetes sp.]